MPGLGKKSMLGPCGPRDSLFRGQIESELMFFFNLFKDHTKWNIFGKINSQVLMDSVIIIFKLEIYE